MERLEFRELVENICNYWERSVPKSETVRETWFEQVKWIPPGYGERLFKKLTRLRARPGNIPMEINQAFREMADYTKRQQERLVGCDQCHDGHIWARQPGGNMQVFRCGHCKLSHKTELKIRRCDELLRQGYELDYIHRDQRAAAHSSQPMADRAQLQGDDGASGLGREIQEPYVGQF